MASGANDDGEKAAKQCDDEGLLLHYDVILCGTGLVQSILASALARAGKTVLHCDANDHYGELDTVWTWSTLQELLEKSNEEEQHASSSSSSSNNSSDNMLLSTRGAYQNLQFHSTQTKTSFPLHAGDRVKTPYGNGILLEGEESPDYTSVAISLSDWKLANGACPTVYFGIVPSSNHHPQPLEEYLQKTHNVVSFRSLEAQNLLALNSRRLALDVTPSLLYASGSGVDGIITSGVADHMEFKTVEAVYWWEANNNHSAAAGTAAASLERVPCSKNDVFQSTLLPPMDKRRFMKFFQLTMDYAISKTQRHETEKTTTTTTTTTIPSQDQDTIMSLNERQLNQGRSLARPQNKAVATNDLKSLEDLIARQNNMDEQHPPIEFDQYLREQQKLSPRLRSIIRYALCLETLQTDPHQSLEKGMETLCQHLTALGRYGTTAYLVPMFGSGELPQFFCRSAAVYGATYLLRRPPKEIIVDGEKGVQGIVLGAYPIDSFQENNPFGQTDKTVSCTHVILPQDTQVQKNNLSNNNTRVVVWRRISILRGRLISQQQHEQRCVIIIPPNGLPSKSNAYAIQALVVDDTAMVSAPGSTIIHFTTVVIKGSSGQDILQEAMDCLLEESVDEIFHTTFSYPINDDDQQSSSSSSTNGLHMIHRGKSGFTVDGSFHQAKQIFAKICPNKTFLALSTEMETTLKERLGEQYNNREEDEEQVVLDSAMDMIGDSHAETEETTTDDPESTHNNI